MKKDASNAIPNPVHAKPPSDNTKNISTTEISCSSCFLQVLQKYLIFPFIYLHHFNLCVTLHGVLKVRAKLIYLRGVKGGEKRGEKFFYDVQSGRQYK